MRELRFIHAADLHLDSACSCHSEELGQIMQNAPFEALRNLVALCASIHPDFLILSGDTYNSEEASLRARLALRDAFIDLEKMEIAVYLVHGNHDPLDNMFQSIKWPSNVYVFPEYWEKMEFFLPESDSPAAILYGISHGCRNEERNLASLLDASPASCLQIGVLHCTVGQTKEERYAPCLLENLKNSPMDYWALGHIHLPSILSEKPTVIYPGSIQGLHINEQGAHGCFVLTAERDTLGRLTTLNREFCSLAPVQWKRLELDLDSSACSPCNLMELEEYISHELETAAASLTCKHLVLRIELYGHSLLAGELLSGYSLQELGSVLEKNYGAVRIWIKDIISHLAPPVDRDTARKREDLLGEILRNTEELRSDREKLAETLTASIQPLFQHIQQRTTHLPNSMPNALLNAEAADMDIQILETAELLCLNCFQDDQK